MSSIILYTATTIVLLISILTAVDRFTILFQPSDQKKLSSYHNLRDAETIPISGAIGPESFAFDRLGEGPYTGVSDGRIIKWLRDERRWIDFAITTPERNGCEGPHAHEQTEHICGRTLGLCFDERTGDLYIADAYMGLFVVGPDGGLATKLVAQADGVPFEFTNSLDIDQRTGVLYFSYSSALYHRSDYISAITSGDSTGRLMKYDPESKQVTTLLHNLTFPNGVSLTKDGNSILVAQSTMCNIIRYYLQNGTSDIFALLPGYGDNIRKNEKGEYWVGIHSRRAKFLETLSTFPLVGNAFVKLLPYTLLISAKWRGGGFGMKLGEDGEVLEVVEDKGVSKWMSISEVYEREGVLWIGSIDKPYAGIYKYKSENLESLMNMGKNSTTSCCPEA